VSPAPSEAAEPKIFGKPPKWVGRRTAARVQMAAGDISRTWGAIVSSIHRTTELEPATAKRHVYSPLEVCWDAFLEWRRRQKLRGQLCRLSDSELMDVGISRGEIDYSQRSIVWSRRSTNGYGGNTLVRLLLYCALILLPAYEAKAQCTAQDVLRNHLALKAAPPPLGPRTSVRTAADIPVWKTIAIGSFKDLSALRRAMVSVGCSAGKSADEILARPTFTLSGKKTEVELLVVSPAELGLQGETAALRDIYVHAQRLGLRLSPAEVAPQLRLQYFDQPIGEFLLIAMEPIRTWAGKPVILTVANGGAGLILIGQDGQDDLEIPVTSRFVFVRPNLSNPAEPAAFAK
jgi:uncharacterized protein YjiS (DUF1127 family)